MDTLKLIREMAKSRAIGPNPSFTEFDVVKLIDRETEQSYPKGSGKGPRERY